MSKLLPSQNMARMSKAFGKLFKTTGKVPEPGFGPTLPMAAIGSDGKLAKRHAEMTAKISGKKGKP